MSLDYDIENTKVEFYDMPEDLVDELHELLAEDLNPNAMERVTKGRMTPMDWHIKFNHIKDMLK